MNLTLLSDVLFTTCVVKPPLLSDGEKYLLLGYNLSPAKLDLSYSSKAAEMNCILEVPVLP